MDVVSEQEVTAPNFERCASCGQVHALGDFCSPPTVRYADQAYRITRPVIVTSRADIASMLRAHRIASNETCEQFDGRAGWPDRYVTKAEHEYRARITIDPPSPAHPDGEIALSFMAEVWLETAGIALVLMPADLARSLGAVPAPKRDSAR